LVFADWREVDGSDGELTVCRAGSGSGFQQRPGSDGWRETAVERAEIRQKWAA